MDVIVGAGKTGASCARYLARKGQQFRLADDALAPSALAEIRALVADAECTALADARLEKASRLIVSPGVPLARPEIVGARAAGVPITGDVAIFCGEISAPLLAVTGSNGKSTVTTLLGRMAEAAGRRVATGGNLGMPCLDLLHPAVQLYVIEMSSFQLETAVSPGADVAVLLNVSPDHMDRYPDFDTYLATKANIFAGCRAAVIAREARVPGLPDCEVWTFGRGANSGQRQCNLDDEGNLLLEGERVLHAAELRIVGTHNHLNVLAALAAGHASGLDVEAMVYAARTFAGLPHRTEWVADVSGVSYFNDSKATNPGATLAAIGGFSGRNVKLLLGGQGKGADFSALGNALNTTTNEVFVFGEDAELLADALGGNVAQAGGMLEALEQARARARPGDVVLLSPACASFDEFRSFAERGAVFKRAVREAADG